MDKSLGGFRAALAAGWVVLGTAGFLFARAKGIPITAAVPVIAAFLVEYPFYLAVGFAAARQRLAGPRLPLVLLVSAVLPYLLCCAGAVGFQWSALARLAAVALTLSLWYRVLPLSRLTDAAFLLLIAFIVLGKYFDTIYPQFFRQKISVLGTLALCHISALVLMLERRVADTGFSFLPAGRDWIQGLLHYGYFLVIGAPMALLLRAVHVTKPAPVWVIAVTFVGILWVLALWEEFLFRGVLQQWFEDWSSSRIAGLVLASVVFGLAHLWFRGFPNWKWAAIATLLGLMCGRARNHTGSIRAGVVTHALVVTTWRAFFF